MENNHPDILFMKEALKEAHKALEKDEVPIGAVVVCAGKVIAINTDPQAPIFGAADYKVVADAAETLRGLLEVLESREER